MIIAREEEHAPTDSSVTFANVSAIED
jgi:hypothetical protein